MARRRTDAYTSIMFRVPNNEDGLGFIKQLRKYAAGGVRIIPRGRGPRVVKAKAAGLWARSLDQDIRADHAESFAIYIRKTRLVTLSTHNYREMVRQMVSTFNSESERSSKKITSEQIFELLSDTWKKPRRISIEV
jgi:hypothetical protein